MAGSLREQHAAIDLTAEPGADDVPDRARAQLEAVDRLAPQGESPAAPHSPAVLAAL